MSTQTRKSALAFVGSSWIPTPHRTRPTFRYLDRERGFKGEQWSKREAQILAVVNSTVGMVGDLQGIAGKAMPEIPSLDIPKLEGLSDPQETPSHLENR